MPGRRSATAGIAALTCLFAASVVVAVMAGPAGLPPGDVLKALLPGAEPSVARTIVRAVRLPRVLAAGLVGGSLAVSGAILQALLRNPLAEPYLLGVSSGAAFGVVVVLSFGFMAFSPLALPLAALLGALIAIGIVFRAARVVTRLDTRILILAGVVVGAFFSACVMLMLAFADESTLRSAIFWTMGSLSQVSWGAAGALAAYALPACVAAFLIGRHLNALSMGEETAAHLGTEVERIKRLAYFLASFLAAATVSIAGVIGFVGLVVPHAVRLLWGSDHRRLVPLCLLGGATFLVAADTAARTLAAPREIPVGVITALIGVPLFLLLLRRKWGV
jgi:iron complex transport system permease protein